MEKLGKKFLGDRRSHGTWAVGEPFFLWDDASRVQVLQYSGWMATR
jgi:hypothetical protein